MKRWVARAILTAGAAMLSVPASAQTYFNFRNSSNSSVSGSANSRTFTSGGITVTATAWSIPSASSNTITQGYLGWYQNGLGVTSTGETGSNLTHVVDNITNYDFITLTFSTPVQLLYGQLWAYDVNPSGSADNDASVAFTTDQSIGSNTSGTTFTQSAYWNDLKLHTTAIQGNLTSAIPTNSAGVSTAGIAGTGAYWTFVNPGMNTGNIWTIGADRLTTGDRDDGFKLAGITVQLPAPEPSTWALMIAGFGMVGGSLRRQPKRRTVAA